MIEWGPLVVGVMFFSIPLVFIILRSPVGKALAKLLESKAEASKSSLDKMIETDRLLISHEERLSSMEQQMQVLKEHSEKLQNLIEKKSSQKFIE